MMKKFVAGQRCVSEPEPELGMGIVMGIDGFRVNIDFPAAGEQRIYAADTPVLKRAVYRVGERATTRDGRSFLIEQAIEEPSGLMRYEGAGLQALEDELSDTTSFSKPHERLLGGHVDENDVFELRLEALRVRHALLRSPLRGFLGGRVDLIPHQFYILNEVSHRQSPRVLLADEVGLGKTIEACLILQRLRAIGRARRALIIVPESLIHQWFVELLRRFNLWFSIFDEERCREAEKADADGNPFLSEQLALCSIEFLAEKEARGDQSVQAGWDLVIVDEAHHLEWSPEQSSPEYVLVERLGKVSPGLLLLTATPTQLGQEGHFARLRLLDPDRFGDFDSFRKESEDFEAVARIAGKVIDDRSLTASDRSALKKIFNKDLDGLERRIYGLDAGKRGAKKLLLRALLDEHGTGRVVFRNTRVNMEGFPKRMFCPAPLEESDETFRKRLAREWEAEATNTEDAIRYNFKDDPRLEWLVSFLKARKGIKTLLICKTRKKAIAIEAALREVLNIKVGLFHEELPLVQRDRNAAWFAEEDGAQLLICSEIGSEGRNFQFAHHLALFDLPLNPGLLEQRIGRLDGQTATIQIHVPYVVGSCQEFVVEWYHQGIDAFETCAHGGMEYKAQFGERLLELAVQYGSKSSSVGRDDLEVFLEETAVFREKMNKRLAAGRDRLLELNSFDENVAKDVIQKIRKSDKDESLRSFLFQLLEFFGVKIDEHEGDEVTIDPSHAFVESFPSLPAEGMLSTFERQRALTREDIAFVSPDHPLVSDSIELLINSERGTSAFCIIEDDTPNLALEVIFVLEPVAQSTLHVERFLSPRPIRVVVDIRGGDLSDEWDSARIKDRSIRGAISRFLDTGGLNQEIASVLLDGAEGIAERLAKKSKTAAKNEMRAALTGEVERLIDLKKINDAVRQEEIDLAKGEIIVLQEAIDGARIRLDSLRLIVMGEVDAFAQTV